MKISRRDFLVGAGAGVVATGVIAGGYIALRPAETVEVVKEVQPVKEVAKDTEAAQVEPAQTQAEPVETRLPNPSRAKGWLCLTSMTRITRLPLSRK